MPRECSVFEHQLTATVIPLIDARSAGEVGRVRFRIKPAYGKETEWTRGRNRP